ncbi:porin family protein [Hymenobacter terrenus]|uniref:porin family protein n=1 Tax=Hymenobacter terrenus TaxID=1629124 RepID=UPI0018CFA551|nr:porin family protein [Hymenobacter terrenus]
MFKNAISQAGTKRAALLLFGLLFLGLNAQAQLGIKAGVNKAVLRGKVGGGADYQTSYHAGIFYEAKILGPISVQPELLYSLQGAQARSLIRDRNLEKFDTKLHYLTLPVMVKATFGPVFVEAGPQFSYLVSSSDKGRLQIDPTSSGPGEYLNFKRRNSDDYKKSDRGVALGAGVKLPLGFAIGGRFTTSLSDIGDYRSLSNVNSSKLKNRVFQAYASFQLGSK